jgi:hypothetical protein
MRDMTSKIDTTYFAVLYPHKAVFLPHIVQLYRGYLQIGGPMPLTKVARSCPNYSWKYAAHDVDRIVGWSADGYAATRLVRRDR